MTAVRQCPSDVRRSSIGELQFPLDRLEARLVAQGIEELISLQTDQTRIAKTQRQLKPVEGLIWIAPLGLNFGKLIRHRVRTTKPVSVCSNLVKLRFGVLFLAEFV